MAGNLAEVDASNIQRPEVEETSAEDQKVLEDIRKKICEKKEQEARELEDEAVKQYLLHFSVDRHKKVQKDKDVVINVPQIEVKSGAPPEVNSDIANLIDVSVASQINTKFDAMSENFTKLFGQLDAKVNQVISGKDPSASTSNAENNKSSDAFDTLLILKIPGGMPPLNHIHSRTTIGGPAGEGNTTDVINAMVSHKVIYSEPPMSTGVPLSSANSSLHHSIPNPSPQHVTYSTTPPNVVGASNSTSSQSRTGLEELRDEILEMFKQTFGRDPRVPRKAYQKPYPQTYEFVQFPRRV
ncbi:unnamed protein product [Urochloa humidicola]